jgi:hypothetical protein
MYSYDLPINALQLLKEGEHMDVIDYIKKYDLDGGFMYGKEPDLYLQAMNEKMNKLLDDGTHSGASWGFMLRLVQAVLVGTYTLQDLIGARDMQEERRQKMMMECEQHMTELKERCERAQVVTKKEMEQAQKLKAQVFAEQQEQQAQQ